MPYTPPAHHAADLVFLALASPPAHSAVDLTFADPMGVLPPVANAAVQGTFRLRAQVRAGAIYPAQISGTFRLRASLQAVFDNATYRGVSPALAAPWQDKAEAESVRLASTSTWQPAQPLPLGQASVWGDGAGLPSNAAASWQASQARPIQTALPWQPGAASGQIAQAEFAQATPAFIVTAAPWDDARPSGRNASASYLHATPRNREQHALWHRLAKPAGRTATGRFDDVALRLHLGRALAWGQAILRDSRGSPFAPLTPQPPVPEQFTHLHFCLPIGERTLGANGPAFLRTDGQTHAAVLLVLGVDPCFGRTPTAPFFILPARFYMTTHNLFARRLPDMAEVPIYDLTLSGDAGSFAWSFSASGPESLFAQLAPTGTGAVLPQQIQITLDGMTWVFLVESLKRDHSFGKRRISISGRSVTALVGAPWTRDAAYNNASAANAQQLAAQALDLSGVALDWGITDWLVPANAWSFNGARLAAVQAIAEAAGGYLQSHRSQASLQVRHPYPPRPSGDSGGPWNWGLGSADIELAPDAIITSAIERRDGPDINAIYVSGTTQGVLALVKRAGTAGDKLAPLQTDALITAVEAAQQRGLATLGRAGPSYSVGLELPVLTGSGQPGVIDVGALVQVNEATPWRGRVRAVSVSAALPKARQTITLERHL
ncbi:MAG: hypothetical protein ACKVOO_12340 [Burkholderiaceae bacterium]